MHIPAVIGAGVVVAALVVGLVGTRSAVKADPGPISAVDSAGLAEPIGAIGWGPCSDPTLQYYGAECGTVAVPLDHRDPHGQMLDLAVSRVVHTVPNSAYQGVMLVNPGGPGASGLIDSYLGHFVPRGVGSAYDWIGFDPRGAGSSSPSLSCMPDYFALGRPDYIPTTAALETAWLRRSRAYAAACSRTAGPLLAHMTTAEAAEDMDDIRAALGAAQINYYGFSYGTYVGQVYATLYPQRLRRMVLDSNVGPRGAGYQYGFEQDVAFEHNMKSWFGWLARYERVYHLGATEADVERLFYRTSNQLRSHSAAGIGPDEWTDVFLEAGYAQQTWLALGAVFADWVNDQDYGPMLSAYDSADTPGDDNFYAANNAGSCTDAAWPTSWAQWRRDNWRTYASAPFLTWQSAWYSGPCLYWPVKASRPVAIDGGKVRSALLIDETLDAASPYPGSLEVRQVIPHSSLIAEPDGTSHAASLEGNACVDDHVADYLADGTLPRRQAGPGPDAVCAPLPQPDPTVSPLTELVMDSGRSQTHTPDGLLSFLGH